MENITVTDPVQFNTLLVPVDFSPASKAVYEQALRLVSGENPFVILLHVVDASLADFAAAHDLGQRDAVLETMRNKAIEALGEYESIAHEGIEVQSIVAEGIPFVEILKKSEEFFVDAIVLGRLGVRANFEKLLFGSTAEKVVRGSRRPVLILPVEAAA